MNIDGGIVDAFTIPQAFWEAKDSQDDLVKEVQNKFSIGYPKDNIVFQEPKRAILWQGGAEICDLDITKADAWSMSFKSFSLIEIRRNLIGNKLSLISSRLFRTAARKVVELIEINARKARASSRPSIPLPKFAGLL